MNKNGEKFFVNVVTNVIIVVMVAVVFTFCFANRVIAVFQIDEYLKPIYLGNSDKKQVSLMVNVYWGNEFIDSMLEIFDRTGVKTTFFIGGMWAEKYPDILKKIVNAGHEIGNHGYFHKDQDKLSFERNKEEILTAERMIENMCGVKTTLFAPPSGAFSRNTLDAAQELGYKVIMWSKDTVDWRNKNSDKIYALATKKPKNGDLILMHSTEATVKALERIINFYQSDGYSVVTVSQNIA